MIESYKLTLGSVIWISFLLVIYLANCNVDGINDGNIIRVNGTTVPLYTQQVNFKPSRRFQVELSFCDCLLFQVNETNNNNEHKLGKGAFLQDLTRHYWDIDLSKRRPLCPVCPRKEITNRSSSSGPSATSPIHTTSRSAFGEVTSSTTEPSTAEPITTEPGQEMEPLLEQGLVVALNSMMAERDNDTKIVSNEIAVRMNQQKPGTVKPFGIDEIFQEFYNKTKHNSNRAFKKSSKAFKLSSRQFTYLYVDRSKFAPEWDYDYTSILVDTSPFVRGNESYTRPIGSKRFAIKVSGKYPPNDIWLGMTGNGEGEWPVSYHGTKDIYVESILKNGLRPGPGDFYGPGVYSTPIPSVALSYSRIYYFNGIKYKLILQTRINPEVVQKIDTHLSDGVYWLLPEGKSTPSDIRPYGVCVYQCDSDRRFC